MYVVVQQLSQTIMKAKEDNQLPPSASSSSITVGLSRAVFRPAESKKKNEKKKSLLLFLVY